MFTRKKSQSILTLLFVFIAGTFLGCTNSFDPTDVPDVDENAPLTYQASTANTFNISKISTAFIPTRLKITADGQWMFVAQLGGQVLVYKKDGEDWTKQETFFYDLGDLGVQGERGLTGLFFGANFNPESDNAADRDVFLSYQQSVNGDFLNRITRVTATFQDTELYGTDEDMIYEGPQASAEAHQIQDGIGFMYEGAPHILVSIGDGFETSNALDPSIEGHGKLLLMQRDGSDPLGPRPWPEYPKVAAIGIRNTYGIAMLPESIDDRRRVLGVENGNGVNDRLWFLEVIDFGHEFDEQVSLGYDGSDEADSWISVLDVNAGFLPPEAVLELLSPIQAPTSVAFHPGGGIIPDAVANSQATFLVACYGKSNSTTNERKGIYKLEVSNFGNQPGSSFERIIERTPEAEGSQGAPVAMDVDLSTGDIYFADIVTGEINRAVPQ